MDKAPTSKQRKSTNGKTKAAKPGPKANGHGTNGHPVGIPAAAAPAPAVAAAGGPPKGPAPSAAPDPKYTVVIVGDSGIYKLTRDDWEKQPFKQSDPAFTGVVSQLNEFGALVSYIPDDLAVGFGIECLVVNLDALLRGSINKLAAPPGNGKTPVNGGKTK
jgi:hypothetical protein